LRNLLVLFLLLIISAGCATGPQSKPIDLSHWPQGPMNEAETALLPPDFSSALDSVRNGKIKQALKQAQAQIDLHPEEPNLYLLKTKILLLMERKQEALDFLSEQIVQRPDIIEFREVRGFVLKDMGYNESAKADLLAAAQADIPHLELYIALAELLAEEKNLPESLSFIEKAVSLSPKSDELWFEKAQIELRIKRLEESLLSIRKAIELAPEVLKYQQFYIDFLSYTGQKSKLGTELTSLFHQFPNTPYFALRLSTHHIEAVEIEQAKDVLEKSLTHNRDSELLHFQLAAILSATKQYGAAENHFIAGLKLKPSNHVAHVQLSKIYLIQGEIKAAQAELEAAVKHGSPDLFVYRALSKLYNDTRDSYLAEKYIRKGLAISDNDGPLLLEYGNLLERRHKYEQAIYAYERALNKSNNKVYLLGKLTSLHRKLGNFEEAKKFIKLALHSDPKSSWVLVQQAELFIHMGSWGEALDVVNKMIQLTPEDYWPYAKKAVILIQLDKFEEAEKQILLAYQKKPDVYRLKELEGQILAHLGKYPQAAAAYEIALKANPDNALIWAKLAYARLPFDREKALEAVSRALELEDFELTGLELYLYLTHKSSEVWGFSPTSEEAKIHQLIIERKHPAAAKRLEKLNSPYKPYLSFFNQIFVKGKKATLSVYQDQPLTKGPGWFSFYQSTQALFNANDPAALSHLQAANQLSPQNPWIEARLAYGYELKKEFTKAIPLLEAHLVKRPQSLWAKLRLALNYDLSAMPLKSEAMYLEIIKSRPDDHVALNNLAWLYATAKDPKMRKLDEALGLSEKAVTLRASSANLDTLAEILYLKHQYKPALKVIDQALEQDRESLDYFKKQKKKILNALEKHE